MTGTSIDSSFVSVTEEQIKEFLNQKFIEEDYPLKYRIEHPKPKRDVELSELSDNDIEDAARRFVDELSRKRYEFNPYTLEYFKKYTNILKNKITSLLRII